MVYLFIYCHFQPVVSDASKTRILSWQNLNYAGQINDHEPCLVEFVPKMFSKNQPDSCYWAPALSSLYKCSWRVWCMSVTLGVEGFTTQEDQEMISRIEKQLKRRFAIGSQVSEHSIIQDFTKQVSWSTSHITILQSMCFYSVS